VLPIYAHIFVHSFLPSYDPPHSDKEANEVSSVVAPPKKPVAIPTDDIVGSQSAPKASVESQGTASVASVSDALTPGPTPVTTEAVPTPEPDSMDVMASYERLEYDNSGPEPGCYPNVTFVDLWRSTTTGYGFESNWITLADQSVAWPGSRSGCSGVSFSTPDKNAIWFDRTYVRPIGLEKRRWMGGVGGREVFVYLIDAHPPDVLAHTRILPPGQQHLGHRHGQVQRQRPHVPVLDQPAVQGSGSGRPTERHV
jgi:hypothetical protein